jgi:hypothetical protein
VRRRELLIGLAAVLVLSMALPAIGASPDRLAKRALRIAKQADKRSKTALREAKQPGPAGKNATDTVIVKGPSWFSEAQGVARAFGVVGSDGQLAQSKAKNISAVQHPSDGIYCIELGGGVDSDINEVMAAPDFADDDTSAPPSGPTSKQAFVEIRSDRSDCSTPNQFEVRTFNQVFVNGLLTGNEAADNGFFFVVP